MAIEESAGPGGARMIGSRESLTQREAFNAGVRVIVPELTADGSRSDSAALLERCDGLIPELD